MSSKSWVYIIILVVVLAAGGVFFWWMYKSSKISPKAEVTPTPTPSQIFSDVSCNRTASPPSCYWAYDQIQGVASTNPPLMRGYNINTFSPSTVANRDVLAVIVARAYDKFANPTTPSFTDVPTSYWAFREIEGLKEAGYMLGNGSVFEPTNPATREQVAAVLARAIAGGEDAVQAAPETTTPFTDIATSPFKKHIEYVYNTEVNGIRVMQGTGATTFEPSVNATRLVVAVAVSNAKGLRFDNPEATFIDVAKGSPGYQEVEGLHQANIVFGTATYDAKFEPDQPATRAMVAVGLSRAVRKSADPTTPSYPDVARDYWAYKEIEGLKADQIMIGFPDGTFKPDQGASRRELAIATFKAKGLTEVTPSTASFTDIPTTDQDFGKIEALKAAGITQGCTATTFCPDRIATRAEEAVFLYNGWVKGTQSAAPVSPAVSTPAVTPSTPVPSASTATATPTPTQTTTVTPTARTSTSTTTGSAKTGPEVPLVSVGFISALFLARYLINRKTK